MASTTQRAVRILVVEDEGIVAMDLQSVLARMGYDVIDVVASGETAVVRAAETDPDLVLMDIALRGNLDGIEATQLITAERAVPVLFLTAHGDQATLGRAKATTPYGYLLKPYTEGDVRVAIEVALGKFSAEEELRAVRARLAETERLASLGRLVAAIGHEISNPLQGLLGCLFLARSRLPTSPEAAAAQRYLDAVQKEANAIADIVRRVRQYYAVSSAQSGPTGLNEVLSDVLAVTADTLNEHGIIVIVSNIEDLPPVRVPRDQLGQVLHALALNAVNAMPQGGSLKITCRVCPVEGETVEVVFADDGTPLAQETREHIFEPFATPYPTTAVHAADMGLPISYQIVRAHGGTIEVDCGESCGTVFTVRLPVSEVADAASAD